MSTANNGPNVNDKGLPVKLAGDKHRHILACLKTSAKAECDAVMDAVGRFAKPGDVVIMLTCTSAKEATVPSAVTYYGQEKLNVEEERLYNLADERLSQLFNLSSVFGGSKDSLKILTASVVGDPATAIVEQAKELGADVVVIGKRQASFFRDMVSKSITTAVLDNAPCPVMLARSRS